MTIDHVAEAVRRLEAKIDLLLTGVPEREWYTTAEFAEAVERSEYSVREWCRLGRIHAAKKSSGRGSHPAWVIHADELDRYRRDGLLSQRPLR